MEQLKQQGNNYYVDGHYDEALECYQKAVELTPENHILYSNICAVYLKKEDSNNSLKYAIKCTKLDPTWAKGWTRLGSSLLLSDKKEKALVAYKKSFELDPTNKYNKEMMEQLDSELNDTENEEDNINILSESSLPNMSNLPNLTPQMGNMFDKMLNNPKIKESMQNKDFQKKIMETQQNPFAMFSDPDMMELMREMMKEL
jgi:stress-induced-phosphoprotein 1